MANPPSIVTAPSPYGFGMAFYRLTDCVAERPGTQAFSDAAPGAGDPFLGVYTPTGTCAMAAGSTLSPLTADRSRLLPAIAALEASGTSAGHLGLAWGWYALSPNSAPVWQQSGAAPDAYGQDGTRKIAIFMTGSDFDTQYSDEGLVSSEQAALPGASSDQSIQFCQEMKQAGIEIFTIGYALPENARVTTVLDNCASSTGMAYHPNHGDELRQAFRSIAVRVIDLHLVN